MVPTLMRLVRPGEERQQLDGVGDHCVGTDVVLNSPDRIEAKAF
jgi:hypothetical protein